MNLFRRTVIITVLFISNLCAKNPFARKTERTTPLESKTKHSKPKEPRVKTKKNIVVEKPLELKFGQIFLVNEDQKNRIGLTDYQQKFPGPDISQMLCFKEGGRWSWEAIDQSIKNLQECPLLKTARINILPELGGPNSCPVEIVLKENFDKQYKLKLGCEFLKNSFNKYLSIESSAYNYKIRNSIFKVGVDLADQSCRFRAQYNVPMLIFAPVNLLLFSNAQFDKPEKKTLFDSDDTEMKNYCENCLAAKVARNTLVSCTKVGVSIEPRVLILGHKCFYNIMLDRQFFDLKESCQRSLLQQLVVCKQNIDNAWSCRSGTNFCFKATVIASKNQVFSEFYLNEMIFLKLSSNSTLALLFDCRFGSKNNFFDSLKFLCKKAASLIYPEFQTSSVSDSSCNFCTSEMCKNLFPPVTDRIKYDNSIVESSFLHYDGIVRSNLMLQLRRKISDSLSTVLFHTFCYSQGGNFYNSSGSGLRYNSSIGTFCLDFAFKWNQRKFAWRFTFGESF